MSADKLDNFRRALAALEVSLASPVTEARDLSGIVKDFELSYELGWKALKKSLEDQGHPVASARHAFEMAYGLGWIDDENVWLAMIQDRNLTVHTYNEVFAQAMVGRIRNDYVVALAALRDVLGPRPE